MDASDAMLERNGLKTKKLAPLLRPSPYSRLQHLDLKPFDTDTQKFRPSGFGIHVLRHFWREHPDLQKPILSWIGDIPWHFGDLTDEELERIADRSAALAAEGGNQVAVKLAEQWAKTRAGSDSKDRLSPQHSANRYRRSVAVRLLTTTATDTSMGRQTRDRLLAWAKGGNVDLQLLTAEVCAELGQSFPRIALTRLKHLANSQNDHVRDSVLAAVCEIGTELSGSRFLHYLSEWFDDATPARLRLLSAAVSAVLKDHTENIDVDGAESFWQEALDKLPPEDLRPVVATWLRTAAAALPRQRAAMVEPLVQATRSESLRIAQMHYASRFDATTLGLDSLADDPLAEVLFQLWTRLDEVDPVMQQE